MNYLDFLIQDCLRDCADDNTPSAINEFPPLGLAQNLLSFKSTPSYLAIEIKAPVLGAPMDVRKASFKMAASIMVPGTPDPLEYTLADEILDILLSIYNR
jgi:hypothetical protein